MIRIWTINTKDHPLYGNHLVRLDSISGEIRDSVYLGVPDAPTIGQGAIIGDSGELWAAVNDENNTPLNQAQMDDLVTSRELTLPECEAWGI